MAPDGRTLTTVRSILPAGVTEALDRTCENLVRVASALFAPGRENGAVPDAPKAALRVENALQTLG